MKIAVESYCLAISMYIYVHIYLYLYMLGKKKGYSQIIVFALNRTLVPRECLGGSFMSFSWWSWVAIVQSSSRFGDYVWKTESSRQQATIVVYFGNAEHHDQIRGTWQEGGVQFISIYCLLSVDKTEPFIPLFSFRRYMEVVVGRCQLRARQRFTLNVEKSASIADKAEPRCWRRMRSTRLHCQSL